MHFSRIFLLIILIISFGLSVNAKSKPINYYIEHEGEQNTKPKYDTGSEEKDALIPEKQSVKDLTPKEKKKMEKAEKKALKKAMKKAAKARKKKEKPPKYKKSKRMKKYNYKKLQKENKAPLTWAQYLEMCKDIKRVDKLVPAPNYPKDDKIVNIPDPNVQIVKYNNPPGGKEIELTQLMTKRFVISHASLSPDLSKSVYSKVYSYPGTQQVASEMFYIKIPEKTPIDVALTSFHTIEEVRIPILRAGSNELFENEKRVLALLDWSEDSKKIAVKEKIGALTQGPWKTQLWTYDFETETACELTALREAIRYYWRTEKSIDLIDYMWDIFPIGWDAVHKDRIIVYAYAFDKNKKAPKFLGTWSIDYKNERPELMSLEGTDFEISINGYATKFTRD